MSSTRLAVLMATGILGGGLVGFYVQDKLIKEYKLRGVQLDAPLRGHFDKEEEAVEEKKKKQLTSRDRDQAGSSSNTQSHQR